jgi:hypothetical protein
MTKISQIPNQLASDTVFWIFPILDFSVSAFVSVRGASFDIRISDLCRRRTGTVNLLRSSCLTIHWLESNRLAIK